MTIQPFSATDWRAIDALGYQIDQELDDAHVQLTMGGEPTYVSAKKQDSLQWQYAALGDDKRRIAGQLLRRLQVRLTRSGSLLHYGLGKLYPGEPLPRWALGCFWRVDGLPLWRNPKLLCVDSSDNQYTWNDAREVITELCHCLKLPESVLIPAYEIEVATPTGFVLPLLTTSYHGQVTWQSCQWTGHREQISLLPGHAAVGLRLPLDQLPTAETIVEEAIPEFGMGPIRPSRGVPLAPPNSIRVALTVEARQGNLYVFMPPIASAQSYADVVAAIEAVAERLAQPMVIEGYAPPVNQGIQGFQITPDPGVLEVNIHPAASWPELVCLHRELDEEAIAAGLICEKYGIDGRLLGTGGGAHITIGGPTPDQSPLLQRPDLLRSLITYWQHHPSLSLLFAGQFVGPTSQAPRVDEGRYDSLYELELAFLSLAPGEQVPPDMIDRLLSPLLQDVTGNTHRTALCIDKLFPWSNPSLRLGLLEFRGFEMPPYTGLRLMQMLLIRALVAWFWQCPFTEPLIRWGAELRDRWLLPYYLRQDFETVLADLQTAGYAFNPEWFSCFWERRFPKYGQVTLMNHPSRTLELRAALEPWPVISNGDTGGASRPVDNSLERLQISLRGVVDEVAEPGEIARRYVVLCNGYQVPMRATGTPGDYVGGIRFRARSPFTQGHPLIVSHAPLVCQVIDTWQNQCLGGAVYHVQSPSGVPYQALPTTAATAQSRWSERFIPLPSGTVPPLSPSLILHPEMPMTLDLRLAIQKAKES